MSETEEDEDWALSELGQANLGDARLTQRLVALARRLSHHPHCSLPHSLNSAELKAAYRFFDHPRVDPAGVLGPHVAQTLGRMQAVPGVLAVQDTTEFNLTHLPATKGLGRGTGDNQRGFLLHSTLAVTPEGLPLGVLGMKTWTRAPDPVGQARYRRQRPIEEKESVKWLDSLQHLISVHPHCAATHLVSVSDREGDIYDVFAAARPQGVDWLVRAAWNRRVDHRENDLGEAVMAAPPVGETHLQVPARGTQPPRRARLALRCGRVALRPPRHRTGLPPVPVFAIHAVEIDPPQVGPAIEWLLLSSVPTQRAEEVLERLAWYAPRWTIETWHRVLKSGCRIEARQFGHLDRFVRATALFAVIAWRILYATLLARLPGSL